MKRLLLLSLLLTGCGAESKATVEPTMIPVEIEYKHPITGDLVKDTIMTEKREPIDKNTIKYLSSQEKHGYYFCNGGLLYKVAKYGHGATSYPVIKNMFNAKKPVYKMCDVDTGKILN